MIDYIMTAASIGFVYSLIPQLIKVTREREVAIAWQTLIITVVGLAVMSACFIQLGQYLTALTNSMCWSCWLYMLVAKIKFRKL